MSFRIFAGNLAFQVTDDDLKEAFSAFGSVTFARVILDRDTGKSRGFGFVEMESEDSGKKAIAALDGQDLKGRQLRLREAEPRQAGGGGGGGGGDRRGPRPGGGGGDRPPPRGDRPSRPRDGGGGGHSMPGGDDSRRREQRRKSTDDRSRKPGGGSGGAGGGGGPAGANQGRPAEKVRGGARNRFVHEDDDDDDIDLFGKFHEDDDVDYTDLEIGGDDDENEGGGGIDLSKLRGKLGDES